MTGIYTIPADEYHADPAEEPSLSRSVASILCHSSPAHARAAHPKLNPDMERVDKVSFDIGTTAHALLLQGEDVAVVVDAPDWRTKDAREQRDAARALGHVPLLAKDWQRVHEIVAAAREQLAQVDADPPLFQDGKPEQSIIWQEQGVTCRARLDWLHNDYAAIDDLKTDARSANPDTWTRRMFDNDKGYDMQARFYQRGVKALTGIEPEFRFVIVETTPPYAISVVSLAPSAQEIADAKIDYALKCWRRCLDTGRWPAYDTRIAYAELPGYEEARWLEKEAREAA